MSWNVVEMGTFLTERKGRYKPDDQGIKGLQRIEKIDFSGNIYLSDKPSKTDMILVKQGDLVISGINVEKGAMSIYKGEEDIIATIHYSSYQYNADKIDIDFLRHFLKSKTFIDALKEQVPGGIKTEIKAKHILQLKVAIPSSVKEQRVLVEFLDKQNKTLEKQSSELSHQLSLVKQLRQAFLREAMQGKLVPQDPNDEPASVLLENIKAEKERLIKQKKIKKEKLLPPISEDEIPFEIPENWVWCRLGDICEIKGGKRVPAGYKLSRKETPFVYIRVSDMQNGTIIDTDLHYIEEHIYQKIKNYTISKNDIYMTIVGATIGKCGLVPEKFDGCNLTENAVKIEPISISKEFLWQLLQMPFAQYQFIDKTKKVGVEKMAIFRFKSTVLPLPPLSEQQRIVSKLNELMLLCDDLEASIKESQQQNDALLQQVLREALEVR